MQSVTVWPVPGRLIKMPEKDFRPVPETGAKVYLTAFYSRAIQHGDLTTTEPKATASTPSPTATPTTLVAPLVPGAPNPSAA